MSNIGIQHSDPGQRPWRLIPPSDSICDSRSVVRNKSGPKAHQCSRRVRFSMRSMVCRSSRGLLRQHLHQPGHLTQGLLLSQSRTQYPMHQPTSRSRILYPSCRRHLHILWIPFELPSLLSDFHVVLHHHLYTSQHCSEHDTTRLTTDSIRDATGLRGLRRLCPGSGCRRSVSIGRCFCDYRQHQQLQLHR